MPRTTTAMTNMSQTNQPPLRRVLEAVAAKVRDAKVFGDVRIDTSPNWTLGAALVCPALNAAAPAEYRLFADGGSLWASLVTADRWLSQSIEADLVHTGDKIEDLLEEELVELDYPGKKLAIEHFRSVDKLFTFRSSLPIDLAKGDAPGAVEIAARALLAYEACFRRLGDMDAGDEEGDN
jgi:hypothetical protein